MGFTGGHVTILGNSGTPSVSRQRLKLETWNLARRLIARCPIVRNENFGEKGRQGVTWPFCGILRPLHISATTGARNSKFGMQTDHEWNYRKKWKFGLKGVASGSCDHFRELRDPLHILATAEARNLKLGMQNDREVPYCKKWKFRWKGIARGSCDHFGKSWDPLHILATAEAINSKFGTHIDYEGHYRKKWKFGWKGVNRGSRDHFGEFWTPSISRERLKVET